MVTIFRDQVRRLYVCAVAVAVVGAGLVVSCHPVRNVAGASGPRAVGTATTFASGNSGKPHTALPSGTTAGDVVVSAVETYPFAGISFPTGWTRAFDGVSGSDTHVAVWYHVVKAGESEATSTVSPPTQVSMVTAAFSGVNTTAPVDKVAAGIGATSPSVTGTAGNELVVRVTGSGGWRVTAATPAGATLTGQVNDGGNSFAALATQQVAQAGASGAMTWRLMPAGVPAYSGTLALRPATASSPAPTGTPTSTPTSTLATAGPTLTRTATPTTPAPTPTPTGSGPGSCTNPVFVTSDPNGGWSNGGYYVHNNMWNRAEAGPETLYACAYNNWYVVSTQPDTTSVKTYPNVHKDFADVPISSFNKISSSFAENSPHVGIYDVAFDIWTNGVATAGSTEIMIWNENFNQMPAGSRVASVTLGGRTYNVWKTPDNGYIALVPTATFTSGAVDLLQVFRWITAQGWLAANATLGQIDFGIEFCSTNGTPATFRVTDFSLTTK